MRQVPAHYPKNAIRRIQQQANRVGPLQSCQSEVIIRPTNYITLYEFTHGALAEDAYLTIRDYNRILPYTTITMEFFTDDGGTGNTPYYLAIILTAADNTYQKTAATIAAQINQWVLDYGAPNVRSMRALAGPQVPGEVSHRVRILCPWGMIGTSLDEGASNPMDEDQQWYANGPPGVDNPLVFGQIGKRKHVFAVKYPYADDYYGDAPEPIP